MLPNIDLALIETESINPNLRILIEASQAFVDAGINSQEALDAIASLIARHLGDFCAIRLISEDRSELRLASFDHHIPGYREMYGTIVRQMKFKSSEGLLGAVYSEGRALHICERTDSSLQLKEISDRYREYSDGNDLAHLVAVPMKGKDQVLGVLSVGRGRNSEGFSDDAILLVKELGDRAAMMIENVRMFRDLEEKKKELQEALNVRNLFFSVASHELKTPLTSIRLQAQLTKRKFARGDPAACAPDTVRKVLDLFDRQSARLNQLVDDMLDVSRMNADWTLRLESVSLGTVIRDCLRRFTLNGYSTENIFLFNPEMQVICECDRLRIEQVVTNLLSNARKYGAGKPVEIRLGCREDMKTAFISVHDHGIGISKADQERIFLEYERVQPVEQSSGLGLGLFIVKQIVDRHRGIIRVTSALGQGSIFEIELPLFQSA